MIISIASNTPLHKGSRSTGGKRKRVLNARFLIGTLVVIVILVPAAYVWHAYQESRTSDRFLKRADALEMEEDWEAAATYLHHYLRLHPDDPDIRVRLAQTYDRCADNASRKQRAIDLYYQALGSAPASKKQELRRRLAALLLERWQFASAEAEVQQLLQSDGNDAEAWRLLALTLYGQYRTDSLPATLKSVRFVGEAFERALELNPGNVELSMRLASIYRNHRQLLSDQKRSLAEARRKELADEVVNRMVAANPRNPEALLARYKYRRGYGLPQSTDDLAAALEFGSDDLNVRLAAAAAEVEAGLAQLRKGFPEETRKRFEDAQKHYESAVKIDPVDERAYWGLGKLYRFQGKFEDAISTWRRGLRQCNAESVELNRRLADLLITLGRLEEQKNEAGETPLDVMERAIAKGRPYASPARVRALERSCQLLRGRWCLSKRQYTRAIDLLREVAVDSTSSRFDVSESFRAWLLLGTAYGDLGQWDQAARSYEQAATLQPTDVRPRLSAGQAWLMAGQPEEAVQQSKQALAIGETAEAWFLLAKAQLRSQVRLPKAERKWNSFQEALGAVESPENPRPLAKAWRLALLKVHYRDVQSEEEYPELEGANGFYTRFSQAQQLLGIATGGDDSRLIKATELQTKLQDQYPKWAAVHLLGALIWEARGNGNKAIGEYREAIRLGDNGVFVHEKLAFLLFQTQRFDEAEVALKKACQLASEDSRAPKLSSLFGFYIRTKQLEKAKTILEEAAGSPDLTETHRALTFARGYDMLREEKKAEAKYREAVRTAPEKDKISVRMLLVDFLVRVGGADRLAEAEKIVRHVLELAPDSSHARRQLVTILVAHGGQENRQEARRVFQELVADSGRSSDRDHYLLGQLYEFEGKLDAAREEYFAIVNRPNPSAPGLATYVDLLLRQGSASEAGGWLKKLEEIAPNDPRTVSLKVRWLHDLDRMDEIEPLVEKLAETLLATAGEDQRREAQVCSTIGGLYFKAEQYEAAERWYQRLAKVAPDNSIPLALSIARQGRTDEAIHLCLKAAESDQSAGPAIALVSILLSGKPSEEDHQLAEPVISKAVANHKDNAAVLLQVANLRVRQRRATEALHLNQQVLELDSENVLALNNLATLLSEQPERNEEALQYIDRAIGIGGLQPFLMDTKGTILLHKGETHKAVELLQKATSTPNADPRALLHLAVAYYRIGEMNRARETFKAAEERDLEKQLLTDNDRVLLVELKQKLKKQNEQGN
jgi:tetratricopeptide (TPR) repeat protein